MRAAFEWFVAAEHGELAVLDNLCIAAAEAEGTDHDRDEFAVVRTLAAEYRGTGVRCTLVSPGPTDTRVWDPVEPDTREGFTPRARMLRPADVAEAIRWVATLPGHVQVDWLRVGPV